jgi:hypothetical protein
MLLWKIRYFQIKHDIGWLLFPLLALAMAASYFFFYQATSPPHYFAIAVCIGIALLHQNRKDYFFLYKHINHPYWQINLEYHLLALPFSLPALFGKEFTGLFLLLVFSGRL